MKTNPVIFLFLLLCFNISAQPFQNEYSILFYNVENLFDVRNDSLTQDDEFTPGGERHWTYNRFEHKIIHTSKVIAGASGWNTPSLIALCEIENRYVLERLRKSPALKNIAYKIIHKDSPDYRGIDVGLLYNSKLFEPIEYDYYPLRDNKGILQNSREVLYVSGVLGGKDTLHLFVNHWPSRYGGVLETREARNRAARLVKEKIELLQAGNLEAKIVVVGDFNDAPENESMKVYLEAIEPGGKVKKTNLYNLSASWAKQKKGTLKYRSQWFVFDQIIVSGALLTATSGLYTNKDWSSIYQPSFLFEDDKIYGGKKPFRTYSGYRYNGGFSDHFPVLLRLKSH